MIDERHEELAALYALDLLEGAERAQFEAALARDPALQSLVRELRNTASSLARTTPVAPPPALKDRIFASIGQAPAASAPAPAPTSPPEDNVVRPPAALFARFAPWAIAACFALLAAWTGQRYLSTRTEADLLQQRQALAEIELKASQQQLEAERILTGRRLQDLDQQLAGANGQLTDTRTQLADRDRVIADRERLLAEARHQLLDRDRQLADNRSQLGDRDRQVAMLTQRLDALAGASAEIGLQLGEAKERIARLTSDLKTQGDLANLQITALASMLKDAPKALAAAVWDPVKQEGVLKVEKLPALLANQDYQLWVVDPQYPNPVDGGVFTVDPVSGEARMVFKARQPISAVNAFAVTRERKGGVPKAEGPFVLLGK